MVSSISSVFVYAGDPALKGPYPSSIESDMELFKEVSENKQLHWEIKPINTTELAEILKKEKSSLKKVLLVIPAGESSHLEKILEPIFPLLNEAVKQGMGLFSTCGGAYAFAKSRIWKDGGKKEGPLGMVPAHAEGPFSPYESEDNNGPPYLYEAVEIENEEEEKVKVLLCGGGILKPLENKEAEKITTLARYTFEELEKHKKGFFPRDLIISYRHEKGTIVLSMVHFGWDGPEMYKKLSSVPGFSKRPELSQGAFSTTSRKERLDFFADILNVFNREGSSCNFKERNAI